MKKLLLLILLATTCIAAQAQKNQVVFHFGPPPEGFSPSSYEYDYFYDYSYYGGANTLFDLYEPKMTPNGGAVFGLEYSRSLNKRFSVGGEVYYGFQRMTRTPGSAYKDDPVSSVRHMFSAAPSVRLYYIIDPVVKFYAKANIGVGMRSGGFDDTTLQIDYELIPLGIQVGRKKFVYLMELGQGSMFLIHFGIGYNF